MVLAHTLGNAFDLGAVASFCREHDLRLIEGCCDALGATAWCDTGCDNTWGKRLSQQHGTLPLGYDHKYV